MKGFLKNRSSLILLLLPLWLLGASGLFKAEYLSLKFLSVMLLNSSELESITLKPIDRLSNKAETVIPAQSSVFFFNPYPFTSPKGGFYAGRLRYQLYPRKMVFVDPGQEFDVSTIKKGSFVIFLSPSEDPNTMERDLSMFIGLERLYSYEDSRGAQAVYRVSAEALR